MTMALRTLVEEEDTKNNRNITDATSRSRTALHPSRSDLTDLHLPHEYYTRFIAEGSRAKANPIRRLQPFERKPGMISLLAGKPNSSVFPITSIQFIARSPYHATMADTYTVSGSRLVQALQYGPTPGIPSMVEWLSGLQETWHDRNPEEGWKLTIGNGSQDLLYKASIAILQQGDYVLVESPAYAGYLPILRTLKANIIPIESDSDGIKPSSLRTILEMWPENRPFPKMLYTVPYGNNPSGATTLAHRRREILALAKEYNFLIFEDDPYFYIYYGDSPRPPSYFALEREQTEFGRVVRFDSLSKIISSGLRLGFACGPAAIIDVINEHTAISNLQVSTFTQVIADTLLRGWGYEGFKKHVDYIADFYRNRRDRFADALSKYMDGMAEWTLPDAGMFIWVKLLLKNTALTRSKRENDLPTEAGITGGQTWGCDSDHILGRAVEQGVLPLPGGAFMPDGRKTQYVRISISQVDENEIEEAIRRLAHAVEALRAGEPADVLRARL